MRKIIAGFSTFSLIVLLAYFTSCSNSNAVVAETAIKKTILLSVDSLQQYLEDSLLPGIRTGNSDILQRQFLKTRLLYKRLEWAAEYFMPSTTRFVNGPPLPEIEFEEHIVKNPEGLQVMETLVYPEYSPSGKDEMVRQVNFLLSNCIRYKDYFNAIEPSGSQIFDASRLQLFRIITLGISGFDAPLAQNSINECAESLQEIYTVLSHYTLNKEADSCFKKAITYLRQHPDFNSFDRLYFITQHANPVSRTISKNQQLLGIELVKDNRLLNPGAETLFDKDIFSVNAYTPDSSYRLTMEKAELGKRLFNNTLLSGNNSRSCASCHQPDKAFTDGLTQSSSLDGQSLIKRNTPTLLNAALQPAQFYDLRASILENQAMDVINNQDEMHGSMQDAAAALWKDSLYRRWFLEIFPEASKGIQPRHIQHALASYIRSLTFLNSRFDTYMRGTESALDLQEKEGFNLFMGKAKCGTCHFMPLFNGVVPPSFMKIETEVIGVPDLKNEHVIDPDQGRYEFAKIEAYRHAFKTTTVRNASLTAPYMHNGVFKTLKEVVSFYNKGGGGGLGIELPNQTLPFDKLELSDPEQDAIIAFLSALDDDYLNGSYKSD